MARQKYVLAVVGSPRKHGNCDVLCDRVLAGARSAGARVEKFYLYSMHIRPCDACETCKGVLRVGLAGDHLRMITERGMNENDLRLGLVSAGLAVVALERGEPTLEDVFLSLAKV